MRKAVLAAFALAVLACGRAPAGVDLAVRATFASAASVGCVRITTAGAMRTVSHDFPGTGDTFVLRQVPVGDVVIAGNAYDATCESLTTQHPTWVASPVLQTLPPGGNPIVALSFHPNGEATLTAQFDGAAVAPSDASCLRIATIGATRTVERNLELGTTVFAISELPVGDVLFVADAFPFPCVSVAADSVGTWHADAVRATLTAGLPIGMTINLQPVAPAISVVASPAFALLDPGNTLPFRAAVNGTGNGQSTAVTWAVQEAGAGTVDATGLYTAPAAAGTYHVVATCVADPTKTSFATVRVSTANVLTPERRTIWNPGMMAVGGIPQRSTICAHVNAPTFGDGAVDASAAIQAAVDGCPEGQVVQLSAGTFTVNHFVLVNKGITLRGAGAGVTTLQKTNGAQINLPDAPDFQSIVIVGPNRFPRFNDPLSQDLAVDGAKGAYSVTVQDGTVFVPGQIVLLDELSGASWQHDRLERGNIWASPDYRVVWQLHDPPFGGDDPLLPTSPTSGDAASWFSRQDRVTAEVKEIAAVTGNVVTFNTPLHIDYRVSHNAQLTPATGSTDVHVRFAGVESLTATGGSDGAIRLEHAAYSWLRGVEITLWIGEGIAINKGFRVEVRESYIHDAAWAQPGGAGYAISLAAGTADTLVENNVLVKANKVMVARCAGAGSVFGYNYTDDGYINTIESWIEVGLNASHMVGPHHVLFEGNYGVNWDSDHTHGNSIYHTVFRNHLRAIRRPFVNPFTGDTVDDAAPRTPAYGPRRCIGATGYSYWMSFVGNVLGAEGQMDGFTYDVTGVLGMNTPAIWLLGWDDASPQPYDPATAATTVRHGNFDYLTNSVVWDPASTDQTLPDSLYLARKPAFFNAGSGYVWPWVDPVGTTKLWTLPAKARYQAGTPFTQP